MTVEETTVIELDYFTYLSRITEYECQTCRKAFLDRDDNYKYCPYCGRKIIGTEN